MRARKLDVLLLTVLGALGLTMATPDGRRLPDGPRSGPSTKAKPGEQHQPATPPPSKDRVGREADRPLEIPPRGWWQILKRVAKQFSAHRLMATAAGITFYALLALFPALAALVSLYGMFADPNTISQQLNDLSGVIPGGGMQIIGEQVRHLAATSNSALGVGLIVGLLTSLWSANQGMKAIFDALNVVYDEAEKRGFFKLTAITLLFTLGTLVFVLMAIAAVIALPIALGFIGLSGIADVLIRVLRWPLLMVGVALYLSVVYRFGPSRNEPRWRWVTCGGSIAAVLWVVVSVLFSWYVASFGSYNKTYGSLGAAVGFMTWIWLSSTVVLLGAEVNAEMEHQTARDSTPGPPKPLGARGARKADTVAADS
jgi:membrane protein